MKKLALINPCELENSAYYQASHARDVVQDAKIYDTLSEFIKDNEITLNEFEKLFPSKANVSDFKILRAKDNYFIDKSLFIKHIC